MGTVEYLFVEPEDPRFEGARMLRWEVMRRPLGIAYERDMADFEPGKHHLIALHDQTVVGYSCVIVRPDGAQIRYVSVAESIRGCGVGAGMAIALIDRARQAGATHIWLNARCDALGFWRTLGFTEVGPVFDSEETSLPHRRMVYSGPRPEAS